MSHKQGGLVGNGNNPTDFAFVFVHSYSSAETNWRDVMVGSKTKPGRILTARAWAGRFDLPILANDSIDPDNAALLNEWGIENLATARNTRDEVESALELAQDKCVIFVSSPDHLPRVVRDAMAAGGFGSLFAASPVSFSASGPEAVIIKEPKHLRPVTSAMTEDTKSK